MARGINKVILVGNLGADPELRYTPNGNPVANVTVATSSAWRDKQTGEFQERTEWHRVVFFNRLAEIVGEYLRKGSKIYVEGSLRTRKWQDKNTGMDRYATEIVAAEMQMLDSRNSGAGAGGYPANPGNQRHETFDRKHRGPGPGPDASQPPYLQANRTSDHLESAGNRAAPEASPPPGNTANRQSDPDGNESQQPHAIEDEDIPF